MAIQIFYFDSHPEPHFEHIYFGAVNHFFLNLILPMSTNSCANKDHVIKHMHITHYKYDLHHTLCNNATQIKDTE